MTNTDRVLLAALSKGDREAIGKIYVAYKNDLLTVTVWLLGDMATAEDALQDVFVSLARDAGQLRLRGSLKNYLVASCVNKARDYVRKRKRSQSASDVVSQESVAQPGPAERAVMAEENARVVHALASLPSEQREVVTLHIQEQMTFRGIAELLEISQNTAQSRHRYALSALKTTLREEEVWK